MNHEGMPSVIADSLDDFRLRLGQVLTRVNTACIAVDRNPTEVRVLPVSKTVDDQRLRLAYKAGLREFGENKVQEARRKCELLSDLDIKWSMIGHLQGNKAKYVVRFADEFQALDNLKVAEVLDRRLQQEGRRLDVYVQVNSSGEPSKYGLVPTEVPRFVKQLSAYRSLNLRGLMTLAIFSPNRELVRQCFSSMRELRERLRQDVDTAHSVDGLSMGMSGDFEIAIEEGATVVRVGQAIFGRRPLPDSYYWPDHLL